MPRISRVAVIVPFCLNMFLVSGLYEMFVSCNITQQKTEILNMFGLKGGGGTGFLYGRVLLFVGS
jgi:hypothetical protein